jgi:hypothetical protein
VPVVTAHPKLKDFALEVEALYRLQQPDRAHLHEVLERLTSVAEAAREELNEPDVLIDEPGAVQGALVFGGCFVVGAEQPAHLVSVEHRTLVHG